MRRRDEVRGSRRGGRRRPGIALRAVLVLSLLAAGGAAAVAAAGCGGSTATADLAPFTGRWERLDGGAPNPDFTLDIVRDGDGARLTFTNRANGMSRTVTGTASDGGIACTLPNAYGEPPASPAPGVPAESDLTLSLDESGQLVIDLVLADGTLEPIWMYQSAGGVSPSAPGTL
jgi:hypothetical protein